MAKRRFALIGEHLGHSLSVPVHQALYRLLGIDAEYHLTEIPREVFSARAGALLSELDGFNVTIPYKRDILPLLSGLSPEAEAVGAVNTVLCAPEGATGHNTDVAGFAAMLHQAGIDPAALPCWVLGTGGASRAVTAALRRMGAASVTLVSRHPEGDALGYDALLEGFSGLLVNTTPAGMKGFPAACPLTEDGLAAILPRAAAVADVIYNPRETPLLAAARARGIPACDGLYMLVAQAVEAEQLWLELPLDASLTGEILREVEVLL